MEEHKCVEMEDGISIYRMNSQEGWTLSMDDLQDSCAQFEINICPFCGKDLWEIKKSKGDSGVIYAA